VFVSRTRLESAMFRSRRHGDKCPLLYGTLHHQGVFHSELEAIVDAV
jgi:hypothetical protein